MSKKIGVIFMVMILCVGCGSAEKKQQVNESGTVEQQQTGYPTGEVQMMYIMVNENLYTYADLKYADVTESFITDDDRYEYYGDVKKEDNMNMPTKDLEASKISVGAKVYKAKKDDEKILVFFDGTVYHMKLEQ